MEHDPHAPPPAAAAQEVADDWTRDEDAAELMAVDPHHHQSGAPAAEDGEGVADAAPPAAPSEEIQSSLQSLELKTNAAAHDAQEIVEEEKETKRHLNVVFIGHVGKVFFLPSALPLIFFVIVSQICS